MFNNLNKSILIPVLIGILSLLFAAVSFFVFISGGRASLIKKKLLIGGLILTLTAFIAASSSCIPEVSCYDYAYFGSSSSSASDSSSSSSGQSSSASSS